ncbi:hypothetical protein [Bacillus sp. MUM 13]|uniref:hypothetical protein n=1 Tax=Bacillus sp. MUM 13 TaxID=1678001 RepID=UPI0008F5DB66|nr:hypothetical protein [Bacillus sp. MUM 13]OIK09924.1 hypothetical protein BIV59_15825 [Bacillus sp. MUM 13]
MSCRKCGHSDCCCPNRVPFPVPVPVPGPAGPQGAAGANGTAASTDYALIYQSTAQSVDPQTDVTFDTNGVIFGSIAHTVGDSIITINTPGNYKVIFSVTAQEENQFALFLNGTLVAGTIYGSNNVSQQNTGVAIITIAGTSTLTLRNYISTTPVLLETLAGGTANNVTASILIQKL